MPERPDTVNPPGSAPGSELPEREELRQRPESEEVAEEEQSLWIIAVSPTIWAVHFLLSYITAAIWCAKVVGRDGPLDTVRLAILVYTIIALVGIGLASWRGLWKHRYGAATVPHDFDTPEDRHRFLGFATLLLSGISAVAVIYEALVLLFMKSCW